MEAERQNPANWPYFAKKVGLFVVSTDKEQFYITPKQAERLRAEIEDPTNSNKMYYFGKDGIKLYLIQRITWVDEKNFSRLPEYVRLNFLKEQELFTPEQIKQFTPRIQALVDIRTLTSGGSDGKA